MELWVRSQDKTIFKKATRVHYEERNGNHFVIVVSDELAEYKTKERCLEIIDNIEKSLLFMNEHKSSLVVYEMPQE